VNQLNNFPSNPSPTGECTSNYETLFDTIILFTGFAPTLHHLGNLRIAGNDAKVVVYEIRSVASFDLRMVAYGDWAELAWSTLIELTLAALNIVKQVKIPHWVMAKALICNANTL